VCKDNAGAGRPKLSQSWSTSMGFTDPSRRRGEQAKDADEDEAHLSTVQA
jgi:hypothetical protein